NRIHDLTLFDCTRLCTGGDGIVLQAARGSISAPGGVAAPANRPEHNLVKDNHIDGSVPDGFGEFAMAGVLVLDADDSLIVANELALPDNPNADAPGEGIVVSDQCCGEPTALLPGPKNTVIAFNDGRESEYAVVVEGTGGENTQGLVLLHNR